MGTKSHLIPSPISNFITHSVFLFSLFLFFHSPCSFPFPVPRFSNIATKNCVTTVIIFKMPRENKGRRSGLKICGDELPWKIRGLYKGCPLLPLYPFLTCVNKIYKNLRDTNVLLNSKKSGSDQSSECHLDVLKLLAVTEVHATRRTSMQSSLSRFAVDFLPSLSFFALSPKISMAYLL